MQSQYEKALDDIPAPGTGYHTHLMTIANYGLLAKLDPNRIHADIEARTPADRRQRRPREIGQAIEKASKDRGPIGHHTGPARG
jgi:hypothetical protein